MRKIKLTILITMTLFVSFILVGCFKTNYTKMLSEIELTYGNNLDSQNIIEDFTLPKETNGKELVWTSDSMNASINDYKVIIKRVLEDSNIDLTVKIKEDINENIRIFKITIKKDDQFDNLKLNYGSNINQELIKTDFKLPESINGYKTSYIVDKPENLIIDQYFNVTVNREIEDVTVTLKINIVTENYELKKEEKLTILGTKEYKVIYFNSDKAVVSESVVENGSLIELPFSSNEKILFEYYLDKDFSNKINNQLIIKKDLEIYVKTIVKDEVTITNGLMKLPQILGLQSYQVYIDSELKVSDGDNEIDLNKYLIEVGDEILLQVKIVMHDVEFIIYERELQLWKQPTLVKFEEEEGFISGTNYNNEKPKYQGEETYQWEIVYGTVSKTQKISDEASLQMRTYAREHVNPYAMTTFSVQGLKEISFYAKSNIDNEINVSYSYDGKEFKNNIKYQLSKDKTLYVYQINQQNPVYIKFEVANTKTANSIFIDDVLFNHTILNRIIDNDSGNSTTPELEEIKARFEDERTSLKALSIAPFNNLEYYAELNRLTGSVFKEKLREIISNMTARSYGEARFILEVSDLINDAEGSYLYGAYDNQKIWTRYWDGGTSWAREHVWPNSRLGIARVTNSSKDQGSDLYNLRAIVPSTNSSRSNRYFDNPLNGSNNQTVGNNAYYTGDDQRGDTARIIFYMVTRYSILSLGTEDLTNDSSTNYKPIGAKMSNLETLLEWHKEDPVSDFEKQRNDIIYKYQGNRNPYVDYPEYVEKYFYDELTRTNKLKEVYFSALYNQLDKFQEAIIPKNNLIA